MNKYKENLDALDNARLTINKLCGKWLPKEVLDNLESYGDYELYNYVKYSVFKELVDKETPMKVTEKLDAPVSYEQYRKCPKCKDVVVRMHSYCPFCGQKLDWSEDDDS